MHPRTPVAAALDTAIVVAFVSIGRRNHDEDEAVVGLLGTLAPFMIALLVAWVILRINGKAIWADPMSLEAGLAIWPFTVVFGMLLRRFVFDDGTAASFVIVATVFLGTFLVGWRVVARALTGRTARPAEH